MNLSTVEIRANLADALNRVAYGGERLILQRRGKRIAALVSVEDLALLEQVENRSDLKAALKARKEKGGMTLAEYRKQRGA